MNAPADDKLASLKTLATVIYALYALSLFAGITAIVAIVLGYIKRDDARGTWLESHFSWQIRTFWWSVVWFVLGALTWIILVGWVVLGVACVWFIYRIAKGWLNLNENKPMPL
ncbi:DUF4870 family protein [Thiobacillus sedimenti]|uniref:Transmembrane protein n=1 Tax=Thiobacillus sedimenti TaxID=3110231 RepID=A0ABZ1CM53_9PROT|nr:hypothetical protein [Thiobacillus sp. SCUT-2]WRS40469.1 hypothetical protein VA613_06230 [Thiobacillus sp. SCUT-2]